MHPLWKESGEDAPLMRFTLASSLASTGIHPRNASGDDYRPPMLRHGSVVVLQGGKKISSRGFGHGADRALARCMYSQGVADCFWAAKSFKVS